MPPGLKPAKGDDHGRTSESRGIEYCPDRIAREEAFRTRVHLEAGLERPEGPLRFVGPATAPGAPQRLLGIRLWWKTIGEFSDNIGFRLELWRPEYLRQAEAFVADYAAQARETKLDLYPAFMPLPAEGRQHTA